MKIHSPSIRDLLGGVLGLIGLVVIALAAYLASQAYQHSAAAQRVLTLTRLDQELFRAVQEFRFERGTMSLLLTIEPGQSERDVQFALKHRQGLDAALGASLHVQDKPDSPALQLATDRLRRDYRVFQGLRSQVERAIQLPVRSRSDAFKAAFLSQSNDLQASIEAVSAILEEDMRKLDPAIGPLIRAKNMAWTARSVIGASIMVFNSAIAQHRSFTTAEHTALLFNKGVIAQAWSLVERIVGDAETPDALKTAYQEAQAGYFTGGFADRYVQLFTALGDGALPDIALPAWRAQTEAPQLAVGRVALVAMDQIAARAEEVARLARLQAIVFAIALVAAVALATSGILLVMFRVSRPIVELTRIMQRLADDDLTVAVPNPARNDEIGGMAAAVRVFKDCLIHRHALESEAIESRERAIALANRVVQERDRAEAASKAKSDFLANMSHELRTPLNAILGYAQVLRRDGSLGEQCAHGLDTIAGSGRHLLALINDVLDFSKMEAGKLAIDLHVMNLTTFVARVGDVIEVKAREKGLSFAQQVAAELPVWVKADELHLRQVLFNLLGNAVKFTSQGQVRLEVSLQSQDNLIAVTRFAVSDTGVGIAARDISTIFSPFEQLGNARHRQGGTGLGLSISKHLVELMGGELMVESIVGEGSVFAFNIPLAIAEAQETAAAIHGDASGYAGPRRHLLVVDDNAINRRLLADMLVPLGFIVDQAEHGEAALRQAVADPPDLVMTDVIMPVMDGLALIQRLRADPRLSTIPIVVISASATDDDRLTALESGANAFLAKPVEQFALLEALGVLLGLSWNYTVAEPAVAEAQPALVPPGRSELRALHELALDGDMRGISSTADQIGATQPDCAAWATELRLLAANYQSQAILRMVRQHLIQEPA
jgi:signal transduction histidine kinase/ActR/RegA family two-component response regulator